jgi:hypothetical protein
VIVSANIDISHVCMHPDLTGMLAAKTDCLDSHQEYHKRESPQCENSLCCTTTASPTLVTAGLLSTSSSDAYGWNHLWKPSRILAYIKCWSEHSSSWLSMTSMSSLADAVRSTTPEFPFWVDCSETSAVSFMCTDCEWYFGRWSNCGKSWDRLCKRLSTDC